MRVSSVAYRKLVGRISVQVLLNVIAVNDGGGQNNGVLDFLAGQNSNGVLNAVKVTLENKKEQTNE